MLFVASAIGFNANAQTWTGNEPAAGDFYLYNVKSGKFLQFGANYGTRAVLVDGAGEIVNFAVSGSNFKMTLPNITSDPKGLYLSGTTPYCDKDAVEFTFTETSAGSKTYTISNGGNYLACREDFSAEPSPLETVTDANSDRATWKLVTRQDRIDALASATKANPVDATFYINGAEIDQYFDNAGAWEGTDPSFGGREGNLEATGYAAENYWGQNVESYQNLTSLVKGKYVVSCYGFYRDGSAAEAYTKHSNGTEDIKAFLFAGDNKTPFSSIIVGAHNSNSDGGTEASTGVWVPDNMAQAVLYFFRGRYPSVEVEANVTDGNLKFGISKDAGTNEKWSIWDRFRLKYYGPTIGSEAVALPASGDMVADTWYYIDITVAANDYAASATTLGNIVYTTDGAILIEDQTSVIGNFAATDNDLAATRYYVKSSSVNNLVVAPASYSYTLGNATLSVVDGGYTQNSTFTVTFNSASTNDPANPVPALVASSKATVNGADVALVAATNGFTIDLGSLTPSSDYTISIPAGVYGYESEKNAAISLTIHTPAVFDGVYYLYDETYDLFLGRGANYGTRAVADKYGIAINVTTDASGITKFSFLDDSSHNLFDASAGNLYTDNTTFPNFAIAATTGGYYVVNKNTAANSTYDGKLYIDGSKNVVVSTTNSTVWSFLTDAERDAIVDAYPTDNINAVIAASGISTTVGDFVTYMGNNFIAEDKTNLITTAVFTDGIAARRAATVGGWEWTEFHAKDGANDWDKSPAYGANFAEVWCATGTYSQTVDKASLPAGIYKLTVDGYERRADIALSNNLGAAGYNFVSSYLAANDQQVRLTDWYSTSKPNNVAGAITAFNNKEATNEVYVYLDGNTDLTIKLAKPNYVWDCWTIFNNFTLTYYNPNVSVSVSAAGYASFSSDYALDLDNIEDGNAYIVKSDAVKGDAVSLTVQTGKVAANTGLILKTTGGAAGTITIPVAATGTDISSTNKLIAVTTNATPVSAGAYILGCAAGYTNVGLYKLDTGDSLDKGQAYLPASFSSVKALRFVVDDTATGVDSIPVAETTEEDGVLYNTAGQIVTEDYKGIVIKNGKKYIQK